MKEETDVENVKKPDKGLFDRILSYIEDKFFGCSVILLVVMTIFITCDAAARYILGNPIPGGYEISEEYMLPALTFFALSAVFVMGGHVRVTMLVDLLPKKLMRPINFIQDVLCLAFSLVVTYGALLTTVKAFVNEEYSNSILAYPMAPAYGIVLLGMALLTLRQIYYFMNPAERQAQLELKHEEH
jgi:TRAP-type transport system small permease protein